MGLRSAKRAVQALAQADSPVHAVLFYGMQGSGKSELASILAQSWLCTNPDVRGCGECRACQSFLRGHSADILRIAPGGPSNLIKLNTLIEMPPDNEPPPLPMQDFLRTMPLMAKCKVVIIQEIDRLVPRAVGAILKTLEEPHPFAKYILTTNSVGQVVPTILSRCVAVACELPATGDREPPGESKLTDTDWFFAEGAPGRAQTVALDHDAYESILAFADSLAERQPGEALVLADQFRAIAERLEARAGIGMRAAQAKALEAFGLAIERTTPTRPEAVHLIAEAHRRVIGNGSASLALDAMFSQMLLEGLR